MACIFAIDDDFVKQPRVILVSLYINVAENTAQTAQSASINF